MTQTRICILAILVAVLALGCGKSRALNDPEDYADRGDEYFAKGEFDKAIAEFNRALAVDPHFGQALYGRGSAYISKRMYAQGLADYRELVRVDHGSAEAHNILAWTLATCPQDDLRDGKLAVHHAGTARVLDNDEPYYKDTLAAAFAEIGSFKEAIIWQQEALKHTELSPEDRKEFQLRLKLYQERKPYRDTENETR